MKSGFGFRFGSKVDAAFRIYIDFLWAFDLIVFFEGSVRVLEGCRLKGC